MMVLIRNPNNDYIRQLIWTQEEGAEGTVHLQCYLKLIKQQRMSFVKKLYPAGHFKPVANAEYIRNAVDYAQKDDETTRGAHVNTLADTIADPVYLLNRLIRTIIDREFVDASHELNADQLFNILLFCKSSHDTFVKKMLAWIQDEETLLIRARPSVCKLLVSAQYSKIKTDYLTPLIKYNIDSFIRTRDADDNEGTRTGETEYDESKSVSSSEESGAEEEDEGSGDEGTDASDYEGSEGEDGD